MHKKDAPKYFNEELSFILEKKMKQETTKVVDVTI